MWVVTEVFRIALVFRMVHVIDRKDNTTFYVRPSHLNAVLRYAARVRRAQLYCACAARPAASELPSRAETIPQLKPPHRPLSTRTTPTSLQINFRSSNHRVNESPQIRHALTLQPGDPALRVRKPPTKKKKTAEKRTLRKSSWPGN